jgi:hypothetical protein
MGGRRIGALVVGSRDTELVYAEKLNISLDRNRVFLLE